MSLKLPTTSNESGPVHQQDRIILSPSDRVLRILCILLWIPAFGFLLPHGIETDTLCPVLGIIPMTISLLIGVIHLSGKAQSRPANIFVDTFTASFLISILIAGWIIMASGDCWMCSHTGIVMVGTYGTTPMMLSFCFHVYFVLKEVHWRNLFCCGGRRGREECPHCHGDISKKTRTAMKKNKGGDLYAALPTHEEGEVQGEGGVREWYGKDAGRPSTDDETARLV